MVLHCEEALELLSAKLDCELTEKQQRELDDHLATCPDCRRILEAYQAMDNTLADMTAQPPAQLHENIMAEIRKEKAVKPLKKRWMFGSGTAVAAVAAALLLAIGLPQANEGIPVAPQAALAMETEEEAAIPQTMTIPENSRMIDSTDTEATIIAATTSAFEVHLMVAENPEEPFSGAVDIAPDEEGETGYAYTLDYATAQRWVTQYGEQYDMEWDITAENPTADSLCLVEIYLP